jgi:hypothetical protein
VSPVKHELGFYIPEDDILHSHRRENLKSYITIHASSSPSPIIPSAYHKTVPKMEHIHSVNKLKASNCISECVNNRISHNKPPALLQRVE